MLTIANYLDAARARNGIKSDRALSKILKNSPSTVYFYRRGVTLPNPENMIKLADLCGIERAQALLDLALLQSESEEVLDVYRSIYSKVTGENVAA